MSRTTQNTTKTTANYLTNWSDINSLYETIIEAVATRADTARSTIRMEYDPAHAHSLRELFDGETTDTPSTGVIKFVVAACTVSVHSDGRLIVEPPDTGHHDTTS